MKLLLDFYVELTNLTIEAIETRQYSMNIKFRDIGFILSLCLIIFIAIYFAVSRFSETGIADYLEVIGNNLVDMIPEDKDKEKVAELYDEFVDQVENKKVSPNEVEEVAANLINLSMSDTVISTAKAEAAIKILTITPEEAGYIQLEKESLDSLPPASGQLGLREQRWIAIEDRLKAIVELDIEMKNKSKFLEQTNETLSKQLKFRVTKDLDVVIDSEVKPDPNKDIDLDKLDIKLRQLEKKKIILWEAALKEELELQKSEIKNELKNMEIEMQELPEKERERYLDNFKKAILLLQKLESQPEAEPEPDKEP